jgi:dienelactone hydrolase
VRLLPQVGFYGNAPALSASRSPKPSAPVFLLHDTEDAVIPAAESLHLAAELRGATRVRVLLSGLISRADADRPAHVGDVLELASFWGDILSR